MFLLLSNKRSLCRFLIESKEYKEKSMAFLKEKIETIKG
jgi:hypothetical protein